VPRHSRAGEIADMTRRSTQELEVSLKKFTVSIVLSYLSQSARLMLNAFNGKRLFSIYMVYVSFF
jgi:hypothetical protein